MLLDISFSHQVETHFAYSHRDKYNVSLSSKISIFFFVTTKKTATLDHQMWSIWLWPDIYSERLIYYKSKSQWYFYNNHCQTVLLLQTQCWLITEVKGLSHVVRYANKKRVVSVMKAYLWLLMKMIIIIIIVIFIKQ